jgi:hypothetical protein
MKSMSRQGQQPRAEWPQGITNPSCFFNMEKSVNATITSPRLITDATNNPSASMACM